MKMLKRVLFGFVLCVWAVTSSAEDDRRDVGVKLVNRGWVDYVNLKQRNIVIDDRQYNLALNLRVHGKKGLETDFALKQGKQIKFEINPATMRQVSSTIVEVWLLQE